MGRTFVCDDIIGLKQAMQSSDQQPECVDEALNALRNVPRRRLFVDL